jgi:signal transduction histidine kinase
VSDESRLAQRVEREAVQALYQQGPMVSGVGLVVGALLAWMLSTRVPGAPLLAWYAGFAVLQFGRLALCAAYRRAPDRDRDPGRWGRRFQWSMVAGGAGWGVLAVIAFAPGDPLGQALLLNIVAGLAAGSISATAYHLPTLVGYLLPMLLPLIARVALEATIEYAFIAGTAALYLLALLAFGARQARLIRDAIATSHRNAELAESLARKSAETEAALRRVEEASRAKSQFFAAASHDLRQPLHALGLFAASLRDSVRTPENAQRVDQVLASVDALDELFDELLDISQLDAGQVVPAPVHVPAQRIFERLARVYGPVAAHEHLDLTFRSTRAVLHTDPVLIERILGNLIGNALRYTARGGVLVGCRRRRGGWSIEVWDTGVGIEAADRERVFEEFVQLGNPERDRKKGLGLGLATVNRIAVLLDSPVTLTSRPGHGSVFRVRVPAGDALSVIGDCAKTDEAHFDALAGSVVVVIDDEKAVREGMREVLGQWQCRVVDAGSAAEALAALEAAGLRPAIAVVDYRLRVGETGFAAIEALRARFGPHLPAILVSGDVGADLFQRARQAGLLLLTKPVRAARLRAAIAHYLRRNGTQMR